MASALLCLAPGAGSPPALDSYPLAASTATRWRLPAKLTEISGLAVLGPRLFAHEDEHGIVYEIDPARGRLVKAFALGEPTKRDDFEGIAVADGRFYLVSSAGRLYEAAEGEDGERVLFNSYATGVGRDCEVEGLAFEPGDRTFLLPCKRNRPEGFVVLHRWSLERRAPVAGPPTLIPVSDLAGPIGARSFSPSGIERHAPSGHYLLVAAREEAIAEITPDGGVVAVRRLPHRHRQTEGIALLGSRLALADEGGRGRAHLTLYEPAP